MARSVLAAGLLLGIASGCGDSGADADHLRSALDELASVGGPDGSGPADLEVVGCDDDAEMPAGYASYDHDGLDRRDVEAVNAELAEVGRWYLPKWKTLGWDVDQAAGSATKEVGGTRLRASIDVGDGAGYAIVVSEDGGDVCG